MTICAIHQPNFFPWMPFFDKARQADVFVFLDGIDYPKSGSSMQSWCNRVAVDMHGTDTWFTCPVKRESGPQVLHDVQINYDEDIAAKWEKLFLHAYKKTPHYDKIMDIVFSLLKHKFNTLAEFNITAITQICDLLNIKTQFIRHIDLGIEGKGNELLADICKAVSCDTYLSGTGAQDYMDLSVYNGKGVDVIYQDYLTLPSCTRDKKLSVVHHLFNTPQQEWSAF